ncbi:MAG: hypothetical protein ACPGVU_07880 [Limisphaerales bacterium]
MTLDPFGSIPLIPQLISTPSGLWTVSAALVVAFVLLHRKDERSGIITFPLATFLALGCLDQSLSDSNSAIYIRQEFGIAYAWHLFLASLLPLLATGHSFRSAARQWRRQASGCL